MTEHLSFYIDKNVSPVRQDIKDHIKHFQRRESLYKFLGVSQNLLKNKSIIEIGPGSGQNSLYIASTKPKKIVLVEPNPSGIDQIKNNYDSWPMDHIKPEIINEDFLNYKTSEKFDIVIAECWLGRTNLGKILIKKLESITKKNGIIILTATPNIGLLSNALRAALAYRILNNNSHDFNNDGNILLQAFQSHLNTLNDMSRYHIDWVQDNLLNPAALEEIIHPHEIIGLLDESNLLSSYPSFFESWEWYKSLHSENTNISNKWINQFNKKSHNFLDSKIISTELLDTSNIKLEYLSREISERIIKIRRHDMPDETLITLVNKLIDYIPHSHAPIVISIKEWLKCYKEDKITKEMISNLNKFKNWFGRELIYMSFTKN